MLTLDNNGSAWLPFVPIPNLPALNGLTLYSQLFELAGSGLAHTNAIAATAAAGSCSVQVQATGITFDQNGTGEATFRSINVTAGCTWQAVGQNVALPANGVTTTGRRGVGNNKIVDINHAGIGAGTLVSIQLEVWCTCNGVTSQHFLFARGTK